MYCKFLKTTSYRNPFFKTRLHTSTNCPILDGCGIRNRRRFVVTNVFTGIIQGKARVKSMERELDLTHFAFQFPDDQSDRVSIGSSVAINGACLTATSIQNDVITFDAIRETLSITNLSELEVGSIVNYERAARFGDEIGGHTVSGHIHTVATVSGLDRSENEWKVSFSVDKPWMKYILSKGFVAVNGASLTACEATDLGFSVYLIPETLRITTMGDLNIGDQVNIEIEAQTQAIVDTVERILAKYLKKEQTEQLL
eukprot:g9233.t1